MERRNERRKRKYSEGTSQVVAGNVAINGGEIEEHSVDSSLEIVATGRSQTSTRRRRDSARQERIQDFQDSSSEVVLEQALNEGEVNVEAIDAHASLDVVDGSTDTIRRFLADTGGKIDAKITREEFDVTVRQSRNAASQDGGLFEANDPRGDRHSRGEVAVAKAVNRGHVSQTHEDYKISIEAEEGFSAHIHQSFADGGKIVDKRKGGSLTVTVRARQSIGESSQASGRPQESVNTCSDRPTRLSGISRDSKGEKIYITVRDYTTQSTKKMEVRSSDKVEIIWEKLGVSKGSKKLFDSEGKELLEGMTFRENGVKSDDVIRAAEEQEVVAGSARDGTWRIR